MAAFHRAAGLIEPIFFPMLIRGRQFRVKRWLETFPPDELHTRPQLCLNYVWIMLFTGQVDSYKPLLQIAEYIWRSENNQPKLGQVFNLQANVARLRGDTARAIELAQQAMACLSEEDLFQRSISAMVLGAEYVSTGRVTEAEEMLSQAGTLSQLTDNLLVQLIARLRLGDVQVMQGQFHRAGQIYAEVLELAGERPLWQRVEAHIALGRLHRQWNNLDTAQTYLQQGLELAKKTRREIYLSRGHWRWANSGRPAARLSKRPRPLSRLLSQPNSLGTPPPLGTRGQIRCGCGSPQPGPILRPLPAGRRNTPCPQMIPQLTSGKWSIWCWPGCFSPKMSPTRPYLCSTACCCCGVGWAGRQPDQDIGAANIGSSGPGATR